MEILNINQFKICYRGGWCFAATFIKKGHPNVQSFYGIIKLLCALSNLYGVFFCGFQVPTEF